jgi:hypothetical protein
VLDVEPALPKGNAKSVYRTAIGPIGTPLMRPTTYLSSRFGTLYSPPVRHHLGRQAAALTV